MKKSTIATRRSPPSSLDPNGFYFFAFSKSEGRCMASMRASPLSPRSHFPLSASFFPAACSPPVSMERQSFIGPRQSRGALYKKRALSAAMVALLRLPIPGRSSAGGEAADHLLISPVYGGGKGAPSAPPHRAIPPLAPPSHRPGGFSGERLPGPPSQPGCLRQGLRPLHGEEVPFPCWEPPPTSPSPIRRGKSRGCRGGNRPFFRRLERTAHR